MEKLLEMANKVCDSAEVYSVAYRSNTVSFQDARLHDIDSAYQSGVSLRVIKGGKLGFAFTKNLLDRRELLQNAVDSLAGGVEADYTFPLTRELPELDTYDPALETLSSKEMVEECARVCEVLKSRTEGEILASSASWIGEVRILNSEGADLSEKGSSYSIYGAVVYPGGASGVIREFREKRFKKMPDNSLGEIVELYNLSSKVVEPKRGRMKVLFMPNGLLAFIWRILSGTSSKSVYEKTSPIAEKIGEKIFDEKMTVRDDPTNDSFPGARGFDDEGVACKPLVIVENGVLKDFYYDLDYAGKLNAASSGHGYRVGPRGADPVTLKPTPALNHMTIKPGDKSFRELVAAIDRGLVVEGCLGAHSGNIPNGDYSVGASPGLYVENGEIVGRVKDAMVAGNIYETLKNVVGIGDTLYPSHGGAWMPAVLFDDVSVATKG
jgi:PmbA protein